MQPNAKLKAILEGCANLNHLWGSALDSRALFCKDLFLSNCVYLRFTHINNMQSKFYIGSATHHALDREYSRSHKYLQLTNDKLVQAELALRYWREQNTTSMSGHQSLFLHAVLTIEVWNSPSSKNGKHG